MKYGTVKVSEEFIKPDGTKKWYAHERQYNQDTEDAADAFAKAEVEMNAYIKSNGQGIIDSSLPPGPRPVINVERTSEDVRIAGLIRSMYACVRLDGDDGLFSFYTLASANVETKAVYDVVKNKLVSKESNELLAATNAHVEAANKKRNK